MGWVRTLKRHYSYIGCAALTNAPMNGILPFSTRDTALGSPSMKNTNASRNEECGPQTNIAAFIF